MFAPFFFQGTGEAPPTPRDIIGKSLRFRGAQYLINTGLGRPAGNFTLSFWLKSATTNTDGMGLYGANTGTNDGYNIGARQSNPPSTVRRRNSGGFAQLSDGSLRDPSAWYHLVFQSESNVTTLFINGAQQTLTASTFPASSTTIIGAANSNVPDEAFFGYMADVYCIDGQALLPTAFGRYNDDGVWVPIEGDFTPAEMRWSDFLTCSGSGFAAASPATNAFDGLTTTFAEGQDANSVITWTPPNGVAYASSVQVWSQRADNTASINGGTAVALNENAITEIATGAGTINTLTITGTNNRQASLGIIEIDSYPVLNPFIWSDGLWANPTTTFTTDTSQLNKTFLSGYPATNAFDGNDSTTCIAEGAGGNWITWIGNLTNVTTLEVRSDSLQQIYVNGELASITPAAGPSAQTYTITSPPETINNISCQAQSAANARIYAITVNGQVLVDGTNPSYGQNGFHLQFADTSNIGLDTSGNGNDFTATGFDFSPVGVWSDDLFTNNFDEAVPNFNSTEKSFYVTTPADQGFNGNNANYAGTGNPGSWLFWRPTPQTVQSTIALQCNFELESIYINEVLVDWNDVQDGGGGVKINPIIPFTGTLSNLAWRGKASTFAATVAILQIDGVTYIDNLGANYDSMQDSPTQNQGTLNPIGTTTGAFTKANLEFTTASPGVTQGGYGTFPMQSGKWYWEVNTTTHAEIGITRNHLPNAQGADQTGNNAVALQGENGRLYVNGSSTVYTSPFSNCIIGLAFDADNGNLWFSQDGGWLGGASLAEIEAGDTTNAAVTGLENALYTAYIVNDNGALQNHNFGQQPFLYTPPAGFEALQTQNLPAATIADGRDYFQAITGPGEGTGFAYGNQSLNQAAGNQYDPFDPETTTLPKAAFPSTTDNVPSGSYTGHILDFLAEYNSVTGTFSMGDSLELQILLSADGVTWRNQGDITDWTGDVTFSDGQPFRYIRLLGAGVSANVSYGLFITAVNGGNGLGILGRAQEAFPKGLYWIKDIENANQWQFVSFMTGIGTGNYSSQCAAVVGSVNPTRGFTFLFDGDLSGTGYMAMSAVNDVFRWTPTGGIPFTKNIIWYPYVGHTYTYKISVDNVETTVSVPTTGSYGDPYTIYEGSGTLNYIEVSGYYATSMGVAIDDELLIDSGNARALQCPASGPLTSYVPPTGNSIAYCWNSVNDAVINTDGTTPSQVSADPKSGFSIVAYNGTGANATVGHGLGTAPEFMIIKQRDATRNFSVYDQDAGNNNILFLNLANAVSPAAEYWQNTDPTADVFSIGTSTFVNAVGAYVAYCWTSIPGFSATGSYTGNGNADGPFIYTGFETAFVLIKRINNADHWTVRSVGMEPAYNPMSYELNPDMTNPAQTTSTNTDVDFLSNGFKLRSNDSRINGSESYIYLAFASNPFGADNTSPVTAY